MAIALLAGSGGGFGLLSVRIGLNRFLLGLQAGMGKRAGGFEDRPRQRQERRSWGGGAHGAGQTDAVRHLAVDRSLASLDADCGMDQFTGERRGDGQSNCAVRLGQIGLCG